jgi:predicted alpha/beta-fold hydrolase
MTALASLPRSGRGLASERRVVRVDDTTSVRVELERPAGSAVAGLVLVHGLVGSSESPYMVGTAAKAVRAGLVVARVNARNCGGTEALTRTAYNGGLTAEIEAAARLLLEEGGVASVHVAGFSIGGNMALKLAADWGDAAPSWVRSVAAVSPCVDFDASARLLEHGLFRRLVQRRFLRELRRIVRRRHALDGLPPPDFHGAGGMRRFDDRFTSPMSGYAGVDDYYARASVRARLAAIRVPTLIVAAEDDPLVPFEAFAAVERCPSIRLLSTPRGGHVAFVAARRARCDGWRDLDRYWAENRVVQIAATLGDLEGGQRLG